MVKRRPGKGGVSSAVEAVDLEEDESVGDRDGAAKTPVFGVVWNGGPEEQEVVVVDDIAERELLVDSACGRDDRMIPAPAGAGKFVAEEQ